MSHHITIYTDGSARGNPGPGGYGIVFLLGDKMKEMSQGFRHTTNNRMELMSVCVALETLKGEGHHVTIYSDSKYVVESINQKWVWGWEQKNFKGKKNQDLWERFLDIYPKHKLTMKWVKGHAENPFNERCDVLAVSAALGKDLYEDVGYNPE